MAKNLRVECVLEGEGSPIRCSVMLTEGDPGELKVAYASGKGAVEFAKQVEVSFERFAGVLKNPVALVRYLTQLMDLFKR